MRKLALAIATGAVLASSLAALSFASPSDVMGVNAKLTVKEEVPAQAVKNTKASGQFAASLRGNKLAWKLTFSGLTGPAAGAHIHLGGMGTAGDVVIVLCASTCKSGKTGTATLSAALLKDLTKHLLYVNVHTAKNPAGEIRGQLAES